MNNGNFAKVIGADERTVANWELNKHVIRQSTLNNMVLLVITNTPSVLRGVLKKICVVIFFLKISPVFLQFNILPHL